jgi:hypothetical protein
MTDLAYAAGIIILFAVILWMAEAFANMETKERGQRK